MPKESMKDWTEATKEGKLKDAGQKQKPLSEMKSELAHAKWELAKTSLSV